MNTSNTFPFIETSAKFEVISGVFEISLVAVYTTVLALLFLFGHVWTIGSAVSRFVVWVFSKPATVTFSHEDIDRLRLESALAKFALMDAEQTHFALKKRDFQNDPDLVELRNRAKLTAQRVKEAIARRAT